MILQNNEISLLFLLSSTTFKFFYQQEAKDDFKELVPILPCFGLFTFEPLGLYRGILRFSSNKYDFYLIGSQASL